MSRVFDDMTDAECITAKSWVDKLLHKAPQTREFFDKDTSLGDIKSRHVQKMESLEEGVTKAADRCKTFVKSNVQDITNIRGQFNIFAQFAFKNGCTNLNAALSPRVFKNYIEFREQQVKDGELKINSFKTICSDMRILSYFATATEGYRDVNIDKLTNRSYERAKAYVESNQPYEDKKSYSRVYTEEEFAKIMDGCTNDKFKIAYELSYSQGLRIENVATIFVDTRWVQNEDTHKWSRVECPGSIALISKGTQRHTLKITNPNVLSGLRRFANDNGMFSCSRRSLESNLKMVCDKMGVEYKTFHGLRYSFANNKMQELMSSGVDYKTARGLVSEMMYHKREAITQHYLNHR